MTNIIEKLARAGFDRAQEINWECGIEPKDWEQEPVSDRAFYRDTILSVLQTLHDNITPEMIEMGWSEIEYRGCKRSDAVEAFQAMLQSALKGERA